MKKGGSSPLTHGRPSPPAGSWLTVNANWPNSVTLIRALLLYPAYVGFGAKRYAASLVIFAILAITDFLDGWLARRLNQVTKFGKVFDSIMDKVVIIGFLYLILIDPGYVDFAWLPLQEVLFFGLCAFEIALAFSRVEAVKRRCGFVDDDGAKLVGKIKMWSECLAVGALLGGLSSERLWIQKIGEILFVLAVLLSGLSFATRFKRVSAALASAKRRCKSRWAGYWLGQLG